MDFPELPDGYRWAVIPLIPTCESVEPQVRIEIQPIARWSRFRSNPYRVYVTEPNTGKVRIEADKLHELFMQQRNNGDNAQEWMNALNSGAMKW